jgi:hypothetical protein
MLTACSGPAPDLPALPQSQPNRAVRAWPGDIPEGTLSERFSLTLDRQGGEGRACTVEVRLRPVAGEATLLCRTAGLKTTGPLTAAEVGELRRLTERSRLDEGGHIGYTDGTGLLETLMFRTETGRTVVLATVGNKNFVDDPARRPLLKRLRTIEDRLVSQAAKSK